MKLKGLSLDDAKRLLEYTNNIIVFNNKFNAYGRKWAKTHPEYAELSPWRLSEVPESLLKKAANDAFEFIEHNQDFMNEGDKKSYLGAWCIIGVYSGKGCPETNNTYVRKDKEDLEAYIQQLEAINNSSSEDELEVTIGEDTCRVERDVEHTRMNLFFDCIPKESTREILKRNGFKWSRFLNAWTRQLTPNAELSLKRIVK